MPKIIKHTGYYGIATKEIKGKKAVLAIQKARGPYQGKLDLPGGSPEKGETPSQTLKRELIEETGVTVEKANFIEQILICLSYQGSEFQHTAFLYHIERYFEPSSCFQPVEDSLGKEWLFVENINAHSCSELIMGSYQYF
ncbi:MAG: hypothetical protein S4CHLAM2_13190 [Chlamydiales bacterium]|nr:hypothetical protein [Chlamydiales bacterium]